MFHKAHDWLRLARELARHTDEAAQRSAISRAYYAAYHRCLAWEKQLPSLGQDAGLHGVHARLISRLHHPHGACSRHQAKRSRNLARLLQEQRQRRTTADYEWDDPISPTAVDKQLMASDRVLRDCDRSAAGRSQLQEPTAGPRRNAGTKPPHRHSPSHRAS